MPQQSGPITGLGFTDDTWRDIFGAEPAIEGDVNGTAYQLTLPTGTDIALLGSPSQDSKSNVAGRSHKIPAGQTEGVEIPASTHDSVGRTDLVVCRFDPAWQAVAPGPVRLFRIPGVEGSAARPAYDGGPGGLEDMPLYAITRKKGKSLNEAAVVDLRTRTGPNLLLSADDTLPTEVPLGTRAIRSGIVWHRRLGAGGPEWYNETEAAVPQSRIVTPGWSVYDTTNNDYEYAGHGHRIATRRMFNDVDARGRAKRKNGASFTASGTGYFLARIPAGHRPAQEQRGTLQGQNTANAGYWSIYRNDPVYPNDPDFSILRAFPSITTGWLGIDGARWAVD